MSLFNLFNRSYKPKVHDVVKVKVLVDRKKLYRLDPNIPYRVVRVNKSQKSVVVVKVGFENDKGVDGWVLYYDDIEIWTENDTQEE